ncbi:hypothetical protein J1N35_040876 [Gossypium stocksii]|uniref:Uncharacterized protein n=1 Tax=Gossypium stocksii TaxID=47602 RepID=A0A9D3ZIX5_9ROSI|nr:hypothetical protein J1N35_040876 [Gossypium stocksii]
MAKCRIQDHVFNLSKHRSRDSLLITAYTNDQPHCVHVPRQIPRKELIKLLPEKWVTNYEKFYEHSQSIQSTKSHILSKGDGTTKIKFDHDHLHDSKGPPIFPTRLMMQPLGNPTASHDKDDPECCCDLCDPRSERKLIQSFSANGKPLWMNGDPSIGPLGEDNDKFVYLVDYSATLPPPLKNSFPETNNFPSSSQPTDKKPPQESKSQKKPKPFPQPCYKKISKWVQKNPFPEQKPISTVYMLQSSEKTSYDRDFPSLDEYTKKNYTHAPKIPSKPQTDIPGAPSKISAAEATINWQTENALAQNHALKKIDSKISVVEAKVDDNTNMKKKYSSSRRSSYLFSKVSRKTKPSTYEVFLEIKRQEAEKKKKQKEAEKTEEAHLGRRPIVDNSPPKSPPPKQASKSLMIQQNQNPLTKFLKDYNEAMILKTSALQLQYQQSDFDTDYSNSSSSSKPSSESRSESLSEEEENSLKVLQTHPKVEHSDDEEMEEVPESSSSQRRSTHKSYFGRITFTFDDIP